MPDYLDALIDRSLEPSLAIRPRVPSLFEPVQPGFGPGPWPPAEAEETTAGSSAWEPPLEKPADQRAVLGRQGEMPSTVQAGLTTSEPPHYGQHPRKPVIEPIGAAARLEALEKRLGERFSRSPSRALASAGSAPVSSSSGSFHPPSSARDDGAPGASGSRDPGRHGLHGSPLRRAVSSEPVHLATGDARPRPSAVESGLSQRLEALERAVAVELGRSPRAPAPHQSRPATAPAQPLPVQPASAAGPAPRRPKLYGTRLERQAERGTRPQTLVQVSIGRVEVRAAPAETSRREVPAPRAAPTGLEEYLRRRNGGER